MNRGKKNIKVIERVQDWGLYVWKMPDGRFVGDADGNVMNIPARRHDIEAIAKLRRAAAYYGAAAGEAVFLAGTRRISEMEHSEQRDRMRNGLIPSQTDFGAYYDAKRGFEAHGE